MQDTEQVCEAAVQAQDGYTGHGQVCRECVRADVWGAGLCGGTRTGVQTGVWGMGRCAGADSVQGVGQVCRPGVSGAEARQVRGARLWGVGQVRGGEVRARRARGRSAAQAGGDEASGPSVHPTTR